MSEETNYTCPRLMRSGDKSICLESFFSAIMTNLAEAENLQEFIDRASVVFKSPLHVFDVSYKLLASSNYKGLGGKIWEDSESLGYMSNDHLRMAAASHKKNMGDATVSGHFMLDEIIDGETVSMLVSTLVRDKQIVGFLGMRCVRGMPSSHGIRCSQLVAELLPKYFISKNTLSDSRHPSEINAQTIIKSIIENRVTDTRIIENRLIALNMIDYAGKYGLINITGTTLSGDIKEYLQLMFPESFTFYYKGQILILRLFEARFNSVLSAKEESELLAYCDSKSLIACVSAPFSNLGRLSDLYLKNKDALELCRAVHMSPSTDEIDLFLGPLESNLYYSNRINCIGAIYRAVKSDPGSSLLDFVRDDVLRIFNDDQVNRTEFFKTLFLYLDAQQSYARAAEKLFCHKNTVIYRIGKIAEIYGIDLSESSVSTDVFLSCLVLQLDRRISDASDYEIED